MLSGRENISKHYVEIEKVKNFGKASQKMQEIHNELFSEKKKRDDKQKSLSTLGKIREGAFNTYEKASCVGGSTAVNFNQRHKSECRGIGRRLPKLPTLEPVEEVNTPLFMNE